MSTSKPRFDYIDLARGFAILAVVLGHSFTDQYGQIAIPLVYSFHMPFFFIISGALLGEKAAQGKPLKFNVKSKLKTLLLPYVFWGLFCQGFYFALGMLGGASLSEQLSLRFHEISTLSNGAMWFLLTMFLAQLLFLFMIKKPFIHIPYCTLLMLGAIFIPSLPTVFGTDILRAFAGCFFMAIGFYAHALFFKKAPVFLLPILTVVNLFCIFQNGTISIAALNFGNPILCILNGSLGTWLLVQYCLHLCEAPWVTKIIKPIILWGKYSIVILCLHFLVIECIRLVDHKLSFFSLSSLQQFEGPVLTVLIMLVLSCAMPFILRFFSWSFGIKRPEKLFKL